MKAQTNEQPLSKPALLSTLWIFLSLNYIFCDVLSNMEAEIIRSLMEGNIAGIPMNQGFLLAAGISLELPFLMVVLSRVLPMKPNRIANMVVAVLMVIYQLGSFTVGTDPTLHYIFFSIVEVVINLLIFYLALRWKNEYAYAV